MSKNLGLTLINGASGGLGCGLVEYLLENGIRNIACQYKSNPTQITELLKKHDMDPEKHLFQADLTNEMDVKKMADSICMKISPVVNLVNLIGGSSNGMSWKLSLEDFQRIIDMNLTSTFLSCREFIPGMREKRYGRILNVSSVVGFTGVGGASHYCAAKAAVAGLSKALSLELVSRNITVNTLALGYFDTGLINQVSEELQEAIKSGIPAKRFGEAREIGGLVKYLLSDEAQYVTGQVHHINGGMY